MLESSAVPGPVAGTSNQVLDEEGQQFLKVQEHAAAVQLLNRSLAVAHLRAELVKPRGCGVVVKHKASGPLIKPEPGSDTQLVVHQQQHQQQAQLWQLPQRPPQQNAAAPAQQAISIAISTELPEQPDEDGSAQQQQQQQHLGAKRKLPGSRRPLHRTPDPAAAARWLQGEDAAAAEDVDMIPGIAGLQGSRAPGPRITADPALQAQQLAGWMRVGVDGAAASEVGQAAGLDAVAGVEETVPGGEEEAPADDFVDDEEEWI